MDGILAEMSSMKGADDVNVVGIPAIESEIVLEAIRVECDSDEEFASLMEAAGIEMGLYGVVK